MFVTNSYGERLLISRLLQISSSEIDKVSIVSQDGSEYDISKFTFSFLSNLYFEHEGDFDKILTSISNENLTIIMNFLNFEDNSELETESSVIKDAKSLGIELNQLFKNNDSFLSDETLNKESVGKDCAGKLKSIALSKEEESSDASDYVNCEPEEDEESSIEAPDSVNQSNGKLKEDENLPPTVEREMTIIPRRNLETTPNTNESETFKELSYQETEKKSQVCNNEKITRMRWTNENFRLQKGDPLIEWEGNIIRSIQCQLCGKKFLQKDFKSGRRHRAAYSEHYKEHELEASDCGCGIIFTSKKQMSKHWLTVHKGFVQCEACSEIISTKKKLEDHMKYKHQLRQCDQCGYETKEGIYALKQHALRHEIIMESKQSSKPTSEITCPITECARIFPSKGILNAHCNKVHISKTPCPECGKEVKNMQQHMEAMHTAKKYQCDKCPKAFNILHLLTNHELVDHQGVRYYCRYSDCQTPGQEYRDPSNRSAHERKRHGGVFRAALPDNLSIINKG